MSDHEYVPRPDSGRHLPNADQDVFTITAQLGTITGVTEEMALAMTQKGRDDAEAGAKWLFAAWYVYVTLIWSLKGIFLVFLARLT